MACTRWRRSKRHEYGDSAVAAGGFHVTNDGGVDWLRSGLQVALKPLQDAAEIGFAHLRVADA
jgi:hypothetical protein